MQRSFSFVPGEHYHIFNRGVEKRPIFVDQRDWKRFQYLLYLCNGTNPVVFKLIQGNPLDKDRGERLTAILSYALMPNHFHLIVREDTEGGISKFLKRLLTAYSMYFNTKYERSGALFCRPFRARHIDSDEYFRWVFSYVHSNPLNLASLSDKNELRNGALAEHLKNFAYSSYPDYFPGGRKEGVIINRESLPVSISDLEKVEDILEMKNSFQGDSLDKSLREIYGDKKESLEPVG